MYDCRGKSYSYNITLYPGAYTSNTTPLPAVFLFAARCMSIPDMIVYCKKLIRLVRKPRPWPSSPS